MKALIKISVSICLMLFAYSTIYAQKPELVVQTGHTGSVTSVSFSPDGRYIISGSHDKTLRLWDVNTAKEIRVFRGHTSYVKSVSFSPDGRYVISGSWDYTLRLWDVNTAKEIRVFKGHTDHVTSVSFSPDGRYIISGSWDYTLRLWDVNTAKEIRVFRGHTWNVGSVSFSPDGRYVISGGGGIRDGIPLRLWDVNTAKEIRVFRGHTSYVESVSFSPDGRYVISGSSSLFHESSDSDKTLRLWDVNMGKEIHVFRGHTSYVESVSFSPDGRYVISGSDDDTLRLWDVDTAKEIRVFRGHIAGVASVSFSPDSKYVISGNFDNPLRLWDVDTAKEIHVFEESIPIVRSVSISPDGRYVISGSITLGDDNNPLRLWDVNTGKEIRVFKEYTDYVSSVSFSPDGRYVISGSELGYTIRLWDVNTGKEIRVFRGHTWNVGSVSFSPDGRYIISGSHDKTLRLWDVNTGKEIRVFKGHTDHVTSVSFSPDERYVISGSGDSTLRLWDVNTAKEIRVFKGHTDHVTSVSFSPDGRYVISGSWDYTLRLWDVNMAKEIRVFKGHTDYVTSVSFSPDGKYVISGSRDGTIKIWDVNSGKELATLIALDEKDWVVVTPDGRFDGSPDGMKLMHYVQNNQIIPLDAFFEQFYTPKLLAQVVSGEDVPMTSTVDFSKLIKLPPLVKITSPKAGDSFNTDAIEIIVDATDQGGGIDKIRLYQNGKLVSEEQRGFKKVATMHTKITKTFNVTLVPGMNEFKATAFNTDRTESNPDIIYIELKAVRAAARLHILAIGINEYKNSKYNLNYGRPDAQAFVQAVEQRSKGIFRQILKQEIYDSQATRESIEAAFNKIIADAKPQDAFVFFYAGHGVMSEGSATTPADFYLVPYDVTSLYGNDALLSSKGISAKRLKDFCTKIQAQKQLIILDACQSGGAVETFAKRGAAEEKAILQLARSAGVVVLAATETKQFATEFNQLGHGIFTYAFLQALSGDADGGNPPDGKITVNEIIAYLNDRVPELTKQYRSVEQYPTIFAKGQDFPLGVK